MLRSLMYVTVLTSNPFYSSPFEVLIIHTACGNEGAVKERADNNEQYQLNCSEIP